MITNMLALTVFMLIVADILPQTSEVVPLISVYFTSILIEVIRYNYEHYLLDKSDSVIQPSNNWGLVYKQIPLNLMPGVTLRSMASYPGGTGKISSRLTNATEPRVWSVLGHS